MHPVEIYQPSPSVLAITWQGGGESRISTRELRMQCPCSACATFAHASNRTLLPLLSSAATEIREIILVGSSALRLIWQDGHDTGIFPYTLIRRLAPSTEAR